jgi:lysophospholipase L1-like esterase
MKIRAIAISALAAILSMPSALHAEETAQQPLKKDDRIVFLGDSITAGGVKPGGYVTVLSEAIKAAQPDLGIETFGAGVSGNKVPNLQARLEKDVLAKKPTIVFIYIGINDVWHWKMDKEGKLLGGGTTKEIFEEGLKDIIAKVKAAGARAILCTPSVIGEKNDGSNERDAMLEEYSAVSRKVASDTGSQLVDLRKAFIDHLKANNPDNLPKGILTGDGVHLNPKGNAFVATEMGKAIGIEVK